MPRRKDGYVEHLAAVPLFSACSKKDLELVAKRAEDVKVGAGTQLVTEGAAGTEFFVVVDGTATVTADTPMELVVLGQREFAALLEDVQGFAHKLLVGLAGRLREADAQAVQ